MKTKIFSLVFALFVGVFAFSPLFYTPVVSADVECSGTVNGVPLVKTSAGLCLPQSNGASGTDNANSLIVRVINILLGVAGAIAILFLIWGGFQYMTAAGNEERAKAGRSTVVDALIGLAIIILSYVIVTIVSQAAGGVGR